MKWFAIASVVTLASLSVSEASAQGRGGGGCRGGGGGGGGTPVATAGGTYMPTIAPYAVPYRRQPSPQAQQAYRQQQQAQQAYLQQQQAIEAKKAQEKAEEKERKLAYRKERREAEIARRNAARAGAVDGKSEQSSPTSRSPEPQRASRAFGA